MRRIASVAELYAHAIAVEREAAARYSEFAERMDDLGNEAAAQIFGTLARLEAEHLENLLQRTAAMRLPQLDEHDYAWLAGGAPETARRELVFRLMTPRHAFEIALAAEKRASAFFESVVMTTDDAALRALACEMAADEADHIEMLEKLLEKTASSVVDLSGMTERGARHDGRAPTWRSSRP